MIFRNRAPASSRGFSLLELMGGVVIFVIGAFILSGGCSLLTRKYMNPVYLERATTEATTFAASQGWVLKGTPACSTAEIDDRWPCTLTLEDGRHETILCAGDYFGLETGCIMSTPYVTGRGRGVVNASN